jgi:hypothetical protein
MNLVKNKSALFANALLFVILFSGCSNSVTNVYDYYIKNNLEHHETGKLINTRTKLLYRQQESVNKAQLELVAFKSDNVKYLVVGSHKIAKQFYLYDSLYYFDVNDLYTNVRGNDFIRQLGDLSIYFTHISVENCNTFIANVDKLKSEYNKGAPSEGSVSYFELTIQNDVFVSIEKKVFSDPLELATTTLWVGKRKHVIKLDDLIKAVQDFKNFN